MIFLKSRINRDEPARVAGFLLFGGLRLIPAFVGMLAVHGAGMAGRIPAQGGVDYSVC